MQLEIVKISHQLFKQFERGIKKFAQFLLIFNFVSVDSAGIQLMIFVIEQFNLQTAHSPNFIFDDVHSHQYIIFSLRKFLPLPGLYLPTAIGKIHCNKIIRYVNR